MIENPTTLILGAGASKPYQYQTALELTKEILEQTGHHTKNLYQVLINLGYEKNKFLEFNHALKESGVNSVDSFLEYRSNKDFWKIGKISMTYLLASREGISANNFSIISKNEDNWYHYIYNHLSSSFEDFDKNNLRIVTFNYDRSFEQYLYTRLMTFGRNEDECVQKLENIPIIHLYGKIDNLPWENVDDSTKRKYGDVPTGEKLISTSENIKIIPESDDVKSLKSFQDAYDLLESSDKIIFLGIDLLNQKNLDRLGVNSLITDRIIIEINRPSRYKILGTGLGLKSEERRRVELYFNYNIFLGGSHEKSTAFLREHISLY